MQNKVNIYTLGEMRIIVNGEDIAKRFKQSPKKLLLLECLIINKNRPVSVGRIIEVLWDGDDSLNLENTLKTLVSRLRKDLSQCGLEDAIVTKRGAYMWNPNLDCEIDIFKLDDICKDLESTSELNRDAKEKFDEVLFMYNDDLFVDSSINSWLAPKSYYYHNLYLRTVYQYIRLLNEQEDYGEVIRICKIALEIDVFDVLLNIELMQALLKIGKHKEALVQYQNITDLYYAHLGVKPSDEILDFYKQLMDSEKKAEANIEQIYTDLKASDDDKGGFVCEYTIFKDIYRLYMRNLKRFGTQMFLGIVSIKSMNVDDIESLELDFAMKNLRELLRINLRSGDTISRYSPSQFALLLPNIEDYEVGRMVLKRLQSLFYANTNNSKYNFEFVLMKITKDDA